MKGKEGDREKQMRTQHFNWLVEWRRKKSEEEINVCMILCILCVCYGCHHFFIFQMCHIDANAELYTHTHTHYAYDIVYSMNGHIIYFTIELTHIAELTCLCVHARARIFSFVLFLSPLCLLYSLRYSCWEIIKGMRERKREREIARTFTESVFSHLQSETLNCDGYNNPMTLAIKWWQEKVTECRKGGERHHLISFQ